MTKYLIVTLLLLTSNLIRAQYYGYDILGGKKSVTIPFDYKQGFLLVDFKMQYVLPLKFIFDTGAQNTVIFNRQVTDRINTIYSKEISIMGADMTQKIGALIARNVNLKYNTEGPGVERDIIVLKEDIVNMGEIVGEQIHGIIGANYFKGLIVEIDYIKGKIILHDPAQFNPRKFRKYDKIPLEVNNAKPYINAVPHLGPQVTDSLTFLIDTGAGISILLQSNNNNSIELPSNVIEGSLGKGLGGELKGYVGYIDSFSITKNISFNKPLSYFQNFDQLDFDTSLVYRDGIVGNSLLEKFHVVIDYFNKVAYFKPNKNFKKGFVYDKSGITVIASGNKLDTYTVTNVIQNSPAAVSGIIKGDEIIKLGWRPRIFLSLQRISKILSKKIGKKVKVKIKRDGKKLDKSIILSDLFKQTY